MYKRVHIIRPDFITNVAPHYASRARYDFDVSEVGEGQIPVTPNDNIGVWDISAWDNAVWGGGEPTGFNSIGGAWGTGRYVAIMTTGKSRADTRLVGWDVIFDTGGPTR